MGLRKWRKMDRPYLTPEHAAKRLSWALTYRHYSLEDWKRVFWSDETTVERGQGARKEWTCYEGIWNEAIPRLRPEGLVLLT
jgi:hypothetical protein